MINNISENIIPSFTKHYFHFFNFNPCSRDGSMTLKCLLTVIVTIYFLFTNLMNQIPDWPLNLTTVNWPKSFTFRSLLSIPNRGNDYHTKILCIHTIKSRIQQFFINVSKSQIALASIWSPVNNRGLPKPVRILICTGQHNL